MASKKLGLILSILILPICIPAMAADPPDSEINPQTGYIETVDAVFKSSDYDIRHTLDPGGGLPVIVYTLANHSADELDPKISISAGGDVWVVYWRDGSTDQVFYRERTYSSSRWDAETEIGNVEEDCQNPVVVHDGTDAWIAYEIVGDGTTIEVKSIVDDPEPFSIAVTKYGGDLDLRLHYKNGHLWTTWVDSSSDVGWSEYDYSEAEWSSKSTESYSNDTVDDARDRIQSDIAGS